MTINDEVAEVVRIAEGCASPVLLVGHSSGGVVALEALAARPDLFLAAAIYEPPVELVGDAMDTRALEASREAIEQRDPARAVLIFTRDIVKLKPIEARIAQLLTRVSPRLRRLAPRQVADNHAIRDLGDRTEAYARIQSPTLLIGGSDSPPHLTRRLDVLEATMPRTTRVRLARQGHAAQERNPEQLAAVIAEFHATLDSMTRKDPDPC